MKRILIVEDDAEQCNFLAEMLYEMGFETGKAGDGVEALEVLAMCDPLPDFIILDLHMPNMNGWQLRQVLKNDKRFRNIKIIILSGDTACTEVEADAHFVKPLDVPSLMRKLMH